MPTITLIIQPGFQVPGRPRCFSGTPFAIKVQRVLQYKRLPFAVREVGWMERATLLPAVSRSRKLPVLEYDGERIEDSTAIAYFIEARHPEPRLIPEDPILRARGHFLEEWADEVLYWYGIYTLFHVDDPAVQVEAYFRDLPAAAREAAAARARENTEEILDRQGMGRYPPDKVQADICRGLDGLAALMAADGFAAGPEITLADIALFGQFHRRMAGTHPWFEREVLARPPLVAWKDRVDRLTAGTC